jgi:3-(3-hydroxy-phenyl)propionate hydroxylase
MDAPIIIENEDNWLLNQLGEHFVGLYFVDTDKPALKQLQKENQDVPIELLTVGSDDANIIDKSGLLQKHYDATPGTFYLIRPDQHVAARWRNFDPDKVEKALERAIGN